MAKAAGGSLDDLVTQARITNRLLAAQLKTQMSQKELVKLLSSTGATDKEIADVLDTTAGTVSVTKQRLKTAEKSKKFAGNTKNQDANDG
jgi:DNA-binding CsgD family transcriptional regulator